MRIWLAGSRAFGQAVFNELDVIPGVEIVGITCPTNDPLEVTVVRENTRWITDASSPFPTNILKKYETIDLIVCAQHYGHISVEARDATTYGAIGYHPSLLPRHRGPSAVEWTIAMGDPIAGGTVYLMDDGYDTGPILAQDWCHVQPGWTAKQLWSHNLFPMGVRLLKSVVLALATAKGWLPARAQNERFATTEPKYNSNVAFSGSSMVGNTVTFDLRRHAD